MDEWNRHEMDDQDPGWSTEPTPEQVRAAWLVLLLALGCIGLLLYFGFQGWLYGTV